MAKQLERPKKVLKKKEEVRLLSDQEVIQIVANNSPRYQYLYNYLTMDDNTFYNTYINFNETQLPEYNMSFRDPKIPQITPNMFFLTESKLCKECQKALLDRYENIRRYVFANRNIRAKEMIGKALTEN